MKHIISTHYSNDDDRLYRFSRRADPPWYPESRIGVDSIVMIVTGIFAVGTILFVWFTEGGL